MKGKTNIELCCKECRDSLYYLLFVVIRCPVLSTNGLEGTVNYSLNGEPVDFSNVEGLDFGTVARYNCDSGFQASGSGMRVCVESVPLSSVGEWNGTEVTCDVICKSIVLSIP